jgi:serine/threonine protein kinase
MWGSTGAVVGGRYRLLEPLGRGGMGRVWRGRDETLDRPVAVKELILPQDVPDEERGTLIARALREARTAARLRHPGIVTVYDVVHDSGMPWVVMELVAGSSLAEILRRETRLAWARAAGIGAQLARALAHAHQAGVVHRDVKPANVLISGDHVVLTDFGIARVLDSATRLTGTGLGIGSPHYMSPEQWNGRDAGPASDVWSLGVTLYEAVEGRLPFAGAVLPAVYTAMMAGPPPFDDHAGPLPETLRALMELEAERRPDAARTAELLAAVGVPDLETSVVAPVTKPVKAPAEVEADAAPTERIPAPAALTQPAQLPSSQPEPPTITNHEPPPAPAEVISGSDTRGGRRRGGVLVAVGVVLAVCAGLGIYFSAHDSGPPVLTRLWADEANADSVQIPVGSWTAGGILAVAWTNEMVGYDIATGAVRWTWNPPSGENVCYMSPGTDSGLGVLGVGSATDPTSQCSAMIALDTTDGRSAWPYPIGFAPAGSYVQNVDFPGLAVDGGLVVAVEQDGTLEAYSLSSGVPEWSTAHTYPNPASACNGSGTYELVDTAAAGSVVYATYGCQETDVSPPYEVFVAKLALATGAPLGTTALTGPCATSDVPLIYPVAGYILVNCDATTGQQFDAVSTAGAVMEVSYSGGDIAPLERDAQHQPTDQNFAVYGHTFYATGEGTSANTSGVIAVDLDTGDILWTRKATGGFSASVVGADATGAIVVLTNFQAEPGSPPATLELAHFTAANGTEQPGRSVTGDQVAAARTDAFTLTGTDLSDVPVQPGQGVPAVAFYANAVS